jgi:hypothetical protein
VITKDERTAKVRERAVKWAEENYAVSQIHKCAGGYMFLKYELLNVLAAFAESERSSAIKETREECARAMCDSCRTKNDLELFRDQAWIHRDQDGNMYSCKAAAIRALGEPK